MKRIFTLLFAAMLAGQVWAYDFKAGDLCYNITSDSTVEVTYSYDGYGNYPTLTTVSIPEKVIYNEIEYSVTKIGEYALRLSTLLESVNIPNSVTNISSTAFVACRALKEINVESDNTAYSSENGVLYNKSKTFLVRCPLTQTGSFTIPNSVTNIEAKAFADCKQLTNIDIPNTVAGIGNYAFQGCSGLTSITIPNQIWIISNGVFENCDNLTKINLPGSILYLNVNSFYKCPALTEINVDDENTQFSSENGVLFNKNKTQLIYCPRGKTGSYTIPDGVISIEEEYVGAFYGSSLKEIIIPNTVESIGKNTFNDCSNLTSIVIPRSVKSIGESAFNNCPNLSLVAVPNSEITISKNAIKNCKNLTIFCEAESQPERWDENWNPSNRPVEWNTDINKRIVNISLSANNSNYGKVEGGLVTFEGSTLTFAATPYSDYRFVKWSNGLTKRTITVTVTSDTTFVAEFAGIHIAHNGLHYVATSDSTFEVESSDDYSNITSVVIPDTIMVDGRVCSITSIGKNAFDYCHSLKELTIPNSVEKIGYQAFYYCDNLPVVVIPNSVTTIDDYAFGICQKATIFCCAESKPEGWDENWNSNNRPVVWGYDTNLSIFNVTVEYERFFGKVEGGGYFVEGSTAKLIAIPNNGGRFVKWSNGLTDDTITITVVSDTTIEADFEYGHITRNGLHYVTTSRNTVELEKSYDYEDLTEVIIPDTIMADGKAYSVTSIGSEAFKNCSKLTSVTFPNTLTTIGNNAFENCTGLLSVKIPTSVTTIGDKAYYNCKGLQYIVIPNSVTNVGEVQFLYCDDLTIFCEAESKPEGWDDAWNSARSPVVWGFDTNLGIYMVTVAANNKNYGTVSGSGTVVEDSVVTITATPAEGYRFAQWSNGLTNATETITVTSDTSLVALFAKIKYYDVTVKADDSEHGTVAGGGNFAEGSEVTITAEPGIDYRFVRWSNGQTNDTITITVNSNISLVAEFAEKDLHYEITSDSTVAVVNSDEYIWRKKITIPETVEIDGKTYTVTSIGDMAFQKCAFLESVVIPNTVASLGYGAFQRCGSLLSITLPDHLTKIGQLAFAQCSELPNIIIPISVDTVDARAFFQCSKITVYCEAASKPGGWSSLWDSFCHAVVWGYGEGPQNLKYEITSSNTVKVVRASVYEMLTEIEIPETVEIDGTTYTVTAIDDAAFAHCSKLKSVVIPNTVTDIGIQAFMGCANLTSVTLSNSITSIGRETFANSGLTTIDIPIGVTSIGRDAFTNWNINRRQSAVDD